MPYLRMTLVPLLAVLVVLACGLALAGLDVKVRFGQQDVAGAHYGAQATARAKVLSSSYGGWCGNGVSSWCSYTSHPTITGRHGLHAYVYEGYYQERRNYGATLWACRVYTGGVSYHPSWVQVWSQHCYRV